MNLWHVNEDDFQAHLKTIHSQETVFTIGNGYFCTRGTFEEGYPRDDTATLLYGVFDDVPIAREELANAPDWTVIKVFVNGERFRLDCGTLLDYHRTLDIRTGELRRTVLWESPSGIRIRVMVRRFASLADEHVGAISHSVTLEEAPDGQPVLVTLRAGFNSAQGNYNLMHWETIDQGHSNGTTWFHSETKKSLVQLVQTMSLTTDNPNFRKEFIDSDIAPSIHFNGSLATGETLTTEKIVVMYTSRDEVDDPRQAALEHHLSLFPQQTLSQPFIYDRLFTDNQEAWQNYWNVADVVLEGDEKAQIGLRYNIYQLRINTSAHDDRYSIAAKGLTGFGYRGHIFHDTEIFMLPFFTYVLPDIARNLLMYRYYLLPAARRKAASNGYEGAQYPWESTLDGEEATPPSIIHPETSEVIPVLNGSLELHITASIAHAVWEYWRITGDNAFMRDYGAEILLSTAQFWVSRAEFDQERGNYEITNVIGPDEWHEHVDNNVFTNYMARRNIQSALQALEWLQQTAPEQAQHLHTLLGLNEERLHEWQAVTEKMRILQNRETGLFEQFEGFFALPLLNQEKYRGRNDSYQGILGIEEVQKYQIVKQADVLMLLTICLQDFDRQTKKVNWDYYFPITDHDYGSSLTPALHVILACELGLTDAAYMQFMKGALVDLENLRGNTPEGIHAACSGAVWQAAILGVAGLRVHENGYTTNPVWPNGWTRLAFHFVQRGEPVYVDLRRD